MSENIDRREFMAASVAVAAAGTAAAAKASSADPADEILAKRVFFVAQGGALMSQFDEHGAPLVFHVNRTIEGAPLGTIVGIAQKLPPQPAVMYCRDSRFRIMHDMAVGTIDELVEAYRKRLTESARQMVTNTPFKYEDHEKMAQEAAEVYGYKPGEAVYAAFLDDADPALAEQRWRRARNMKLVALKHPNRKDAEK